jgi:hypothetical protein
MKLGNVSGQVEDPVDIIPESEFSLSTKYNIEPGSSR